MDSDADSSLARRRHRLSPPFLFFSLFFVSFFHFLHLYLLYLGFISSSFAKSCANCRTCHIQANWFLLLICSPAPATTAALVSDLTFDGYVCTVLSSSPKVAAQPDLHLSSSPWAMTFLPTGKTCVSLSRRELSFLAGVFRCSFTRSTSTCCSEFYSSTSVANRTLPEDPKTNPLSRPLSFTTTESGVCSYSLSTTDSGNKRFNYGFINALWLRYGNIGIWSLFLATTSVFPRNLVKHFCFYAGQNVAQAKSSDSSIIHCHHLVSETLYPIALSHKSPWCRPKLGILSPLTPQFWFGCTVCANFSCISVTTKSMEEATKSVWDLTEILLKLINFSPLDYSFVEKSSQTSSCQGQERSFFHSSSFVVRALPPISLPQGGDTSLVSNLRPVSAILCLFSCVATCTESEETTEFVSTETEDMSQLSKARHIIHMLPSLLLFVMFEVASSTHPNFFLDLLDSQLFYPNLYFVSSFLMFNFACIIELYLSGIEL